MNPFLLLIWSLFALLVMSPVGYWVTRGVRRVRLRKRLRPLHEPLTLPPGPLPSDVGSLVERTLSLRERLREPMLETLDYVAALPVLEIALHLSRQLGRRRSWGMRMRERFEESVRGAYLAADDWCSWVESLGDEERDVLVRVGLDAGPVRRLVAEHQASSAGWARDFGTADDARRTAERLEEMVRHLDRFARSLVEGHRDPYR